MNLVDLSQDKTSLTDQNHGDVEGHASHEETRRIMQICNACRYCEGYCAVFPPWKDAVNLALATPPIWPIYVTIAGRVTTLANMPPPHEFGVNVPQTLAERRIDSYADYAWPPAMGRVFEKNGFLVSLVMVISLSLAVGLMLAMINPALFWGVHIGEGRFIKSCPIR